MIAGVATVNAPQRRGVGGDGTARRRGGNIRADESRRAVFAVGWGAFWLYWFVAAFFMKRGRVSWSREFRIRAAIVVLAIILVRLGPSRHDGLTTDPWRGRPSGSSCSRPGLGFAVWARGAHRAQLGHPDGTEGGARFGDQGPYRLVRHPIYSGVLVAGVGTAVALSWKWLIVVALAGVYFAYSATVEERYLTKQFPDEYPAYRRSTRMLLPFVL